MGFVNRMKAKEMDLVCIGDAGLGLYWQYWSAKRDGSLDRLKK